MGSVLNDTLYYALFISEQFQTWRRFNSLRICLAILMLTEPGLSKLLPQKDTTSSTLLLLRFFYD
jgi:hypothetical protein